MFLSNFIETFKDLLIENSLTQTDFAKKINILPSYVSRYILGQQNPDFEIAVRMADYFNCTLDYLFGLEEYNVKKDFHPYPEFKFRFKFLLTKFNKTVKEVEIGTGIAKSSLYYWLSGERIPSMDSIIKLAKYFNCSMDFIIGRVDFE